MAKILVIDDEPGILDLLDTVLRDKGHEVVLAERGLKGLQQFQPLSATFRQDYLVSLVAEHGVEEIQDAWLIIDHKNFGHCTDTFYGHLVPARESPPPRDHRGDHQILISVT